jgi:hypothetical protein
MLRNRLVLLACTLSLALVSIHAAAQCLDWMDGLEEDEGGANEAATAVVGGTLDGQKVAFVGGSFQVIGGVRAEGLAAWDGQTWTAVGGWDHATVSRLAWFDDGSGPALYAAGAIYFHEGSPRTELARFRDGQWQDLDPDTGAGSFNALAECGGKLYLAGGFSVVFGQPTKGLAAWDGDSWQAFPDGPNGPIYALASYDDGNGPALIVGGAFTEAGGAPASKVAMYRDGVWSQVGAGFSGGHCRALGVVSCIFENTLYAGGEFQWSGATQVRYLAKWNGSAWERVGGNAGNGGRIDGRVDALGVYQGPLYPMLAIAGAFDERNGGPDDGLRGVATYDGATWGNLRGGAGADTFFAATSVATEHGTRFLVGGNIRDQGDKPAKNIAVWGVPCSAPTFVRSPTDVTAPFDSYIDLRVHTHGSLPMDYIWTRDGVPLVDDDRINGADSTRLTINPWRYQDGGAYECWATNEIGIQVSDPAIVTIPGGGLPPLAVQTISPTEVQSYDDPDRTMGLTAIGVAGDGGIAISARRFDTENHILVWRNAEFQTVLSLGDPMPGAPADEVISDLSTRPAIGPDSRIAFYATIAGEHVTPDNDTILCAFDGTEVRTLLREGDQAPDMPDGVVLPNIAFHETTLQYGAAGTLLLGNRITGNGYDSNADSAIWTWTPTAGFDLLVHTGDIAPGGDAPWTSLGGRYATSPSERVVLTGAVDAMTGYKNLAGTDVGIWAQQGSGFVKIAQSGDHAPGFPDDVNFERFLQVPAIAPDRSLFTSRVAGPNGFDSGGLWRQQAGTNTPIFLRGDPLPPGPPSPPPNAAFVATDFLRTNANGALTFSGIFEADCGQGRCTRRGEFLVLPDGRMLSMLLQTMPAPPGMDAYLTLNAPFTAVMNDRNQIVIQVGFGANYNAVGLVGWDPVRGLFPILVPGTRIDSDPNGNPRVVLNAILPTSYDPDPLAASGLADDGSVTAVVEYTDWPDAIVRTSWTEARDATFPCRADLTLDGAVDTRDFIEFLDLWSHAEWGADVTDDGRTDTTDFIAFLNLWAAGC